MSGRGALPLGVIAAAALFAAGCGGSSSSSSGGASTLQLNADAGGRLKFDTPTLQAKAGEVTIALDNPAPVSHNIAIDGVATQGEVIGQGGTSTLTTTLKPGTYTFYCAVPGHRQAGMQGTLTVE